MTLREKIINRASNKKGISTSSCWPRTKTFSKLRNRKLLRKEKKGIRNKRNPWKRTHIS